MRLIEEVRQVFRFVVVRLFVLSVSASLARRCLLLHRGVHCGVEVDEPGRRILIGLILVFVLRFIVYVSLWSINSGGEPVCCPS